MHSNGLSGQTASLLRRIESRFAPGAYDPPECRVSAPWSQSSGMVERANSLWVALGQLKAGTLLNWAGSQGEQAVYVVSGAIRLGDQTCTAGDAILIDAHIASRANVIADAHIVHFGSNGTRPPSTGPFGPPTQAGRSARIVRRENAVQSVSHADNGTRFVLNHFADGSGPTNRIALFSVCMDGPSFAIPHHHSEDELIYVLSGQVRSGTIRVAAGEFFAVPANIRYSFRTEGPASFLNFRRDASIITIKRISSLETLAQRTARSFGDPSDEH